MNYLIDYLTLTIKPDRNSDHPYNITFNDFLELLGLSEIFNNFIDLGSRMFYEHCYRYENINIYTPRDKDYENMGYCVSMSGQGCRFFESLVKNFKWKQFFCSLKCYVSSGCAVNISRIDFAFDDIISDCEDKNKILDIDVIKDCRKKHLFTSLYRKSDNQNHESFTMKSSIHETLTNKNVSNTIYFGSKKSNSFCRFYDKLVEQQQKYKNSPDELQKLENISHWVRFEIVFKNSVAIKIINSMLELSTELFQKKFAEVINYYISFINPDNDNRYKCSICEWWSKFLGTVEKAKLTSQKLTKNVFKRAVQWIAHSVAPTLRAVEKSVGTLVLLNIISDFGHPCRWKQKHNEISKSNTYEEQAISNEMYWKSLVPFFCDEVKKDEFNLTYEDLKDCEILSLC